MARRRKSAGRRRRRGILGWIRTATMAVGAVTALFYSLYQYVGLAPGDKARIFAAYADLGLKPGSLQRMQPSPLPPSRKPDGVPWRTVTKIIDGDTIEADGVKVRLLGIDTPESSENNHLFRDLGKMGNIATKHEMIALGKEAMRYARSRSAGKRCWLEYDQEPTDQYGRTLAYVHLEDGSILNEEMVAQGYAKVYTSYAFKYKTRYIHLQMAAMVKRRGFWAGDGEENASASRVPVSSLAEAE